MAGRRATLTSMRRLCWRCCCSTWPSPLACPPGAREDPADGKFRVVPIAPVEILVGKYLSYLILSVVLGGILTALIRVGRTILWQSWAFLLTLVLVTLASLGLGFFRSPSFRNPKARPCSFR